MHYYKIDDTIVINNKEWRIAEYRMSRGREWVYTLSYEFTDGSFTTFRINREALEKIDVFKH